MDIFISQYLLSQADVQALQIKDSYGVHKAVYSLFPDMEREEESLSSGFLFVDKGDSSFGRRILLLSVREPIPCPSHGKLSVRTVPESYFEKESYAFEIVVNPVRTTRKGGKKRIAMRRIREIESWFEEQAAKNGFSLLPQQWSVKGTYKDIFVKPKSGCEVTLRRALISGMLYVKDKERFRQAVIQGIGRAKAFGCGLLQLIPYEV